MPLTIPTLDDRRYQQLLDEALARIPVHTPEWTNFNRSDPGVTLIEVFAFLTETLLYRANQMPERNRRKFLSLLGVPLQPAASARGIVTFRNDKVNDSGPLATISLSGDVEVRAGNVPFRSEQGLDILPIEATVYFKRLLDAQNDAQFAQKQQYYQALYASYFDPTNLPALDTLQLYETMPLVLRGETGGVNLADTVDNALWIALLVRQNDKNGSLYKVSEARDAIAGKTLSLGLVPLIDNPQRNLTPGQRTRSAEQHLLDVYLPVVAANGGLGTNRQPSYRRLETSASQDVLSEPGIVQITLPSADELQLWNDLDPLEAGVRDLPPALDDTNKAARVITWLRLQAAAGAQVKLLWAGINATPVTQRAQVTSELLGLGTGEPDQTFTLAHTPVLPASVRLTITPAVDGKPWQLIDDLLAAGPEVPSPDLRLPPGTAATVNEAVNVFTIDPEAGLLRFGDGTRGRRPAAGATLRVDYAYGQGRAGNVGAGAISSGAALPDGVKVTNPVRTWGGAEAETIDEGEKQITRYLQHRDRLVTAEDFATIVRRTPGVEIGRVEVLPAFHPELSEEPGDAAGSVTLLLIPQFDPVHPTAPQPDQIFLNAVCTWLDPRRLVTTEVLLRGPDYQPIWVSVGIKTVAGASVAQTREAVRHALSDFLSPFTWPLYKAVNERELMAIAASHVPEVQFVTGVLLAAGTSAPQPVINLTKLQLPQIMGISVVVGDPLAVDDIRAQQALPLDGQGNTSQGNFVPVPIIPEDCR